ncbi:two-component system chemotaxis family CheB-CheR fusion protein [Salinisphaera shabanensis E1L3A]|uniref:Two-component system chemotaxis family CheB-CheR fusion protein n=1 Tax=Salinisphaera shabanensis E1L3A TaxID=1033802 RepID=U2G3V1_9GAMM|nr:GGDEF domain-containing response regulator [Salinisphaera shabanensis]ERJ20788.1 two-component system chemotaxis family CheB-CheR fusion protein [Salinisphaera shabanensis E1L3A]
MPRSRTVRVLLIDNDPEDRALLANLLHSGPRHRYALTMAGSYDEGLAALSKGGFDICLLDYELGGRTGLDLLRSPAAAGLHAPIVVLTGHDDYEIDVAVMEAGAAEFLPKGEINATLLERTIRYSLQHYESQRKFTYLARHDQVTGLFNRAVLLERLQYMLERPVRERHPFAVIYFDLDGFKSINDSLGHGIGDRALYTSASRLKSVCEAHPLLARLGGDEFVAVIDSDDKSEIEALVAEVLRIFRQPIVIDTHRIFVTISIGVAMYPRNGDDAGTLINNADAAMYLAKQGGRDTVHWFDGENDGRSRARRGLDNELHAAIEANELHLVYQPQFDLGSGRVVGLEALARWNHPRLGPISPEEFVPMAESRGCIRAFTRWALTTACRQYLNWRDAGVLDSDVVLAVNVSSQHARDEDFLPMVRQLIETLAMPAELLELEFTENALILGPDDTNPLVEQLKRLGVQVVIDDFGKGYSSLSYLTRLPVDSLKIDLSFLHGVSDNSRDRAMARAIIALGASLGLRVVAEGVETSDQRQFLMDNKCVFGQGFFYAPGLAVADCTRLLQHAMPASALYH